MFGSVGFGSTGAQTDLLQSKQNRVIQETADGGSNANNDAKIDKGARDFEAVLVGSWLQQAEQSFATVPGSEDDEDAAAREQTMSFGVQQLAQSFAASGGIGIGKMVAKAMHAKADKVTDQVTSVAPAAPTKVTFEKMREVY